VLKHKHILHLRKYVWDITALSIILLIISSAIVLTIVTSEITFQSTKDVFLKIFTVHPNRIFIYQFVSNHIGYG